MDASESYNRETSSTRSKVPPPGYGGENWECVADRMVSVELEAAEALAGLAHSATHEKVNIGSESAWNAGTRTSHRVKIQSPAGNSGMNPRDSVPQSLDLAGVRVEVIRQRCKNASCGFNKSRQNLTEAEKEARRMRRVLANRESARETIRRKQVLYEELNKKAVDLAGENENLKRKRDSIMKEYDSLKSTNECLKTQMANKMKTELQKTEIESNSTYHDISTSSTTNCPFLVYNQPPFMPFLWTSIVPSLDPSSFQSQGGSQNVIGIPSKVPAVMPNLFDEQENPSRINGPGTPFYMLPWFFPFPDHGNRLHPQSSDIFLNNQHTASCSSKIRADVGNHYPPMKVKKEVSSSLDVVSANGLQETKFGFLTKGVHHSTFFTSPPVPSVKPTVVKDENALQSDYTARLKDVSSMDGHTITTAAEARKRRKQLTKLKNLHGRRQFRMHC